MQSVSSRIWTRVAVSISYDDNHYTTGTSQIVSVMVPTLRTIKNSSYYYEYRENIHLCVKLTPA